MYNTGDKLYAQELGGREYTNGMPFTVTRYTKWSITGLDTNGNTRQFRTYEFEFRKVEDGNERN